MATSGDLINETAASLGVAKATVAFTYRELREAGLVTNGGRGRNASVGYRDAAVLLEAIGGAGYGRTAPNQIAREYILLPLSHSADYRKLFMANDDDGWVEHNGEIGLGGLTLPTFAALPPHHTVTDALVALFEADRSGALMKAAGDSQSSYGVEVYINRSPDGPSVVIKMDFYTDTFLHRLDIQYFNPPSGLPDLSATGDGEFTFRFTHHTVSKIAKLIGSS